MTTADRTAPGQIKRPDQHGAQSTEYHETAGPVTGEFIYHPARTTADLSPRSDQQFREIRHHYFTFI